MTSAEMAQQLNDSIRIPTLSASVERLREVLATPDVELSHVVDAFLQDPPLAAKILKISNSVNYGLRESTISVQKAISVLGLRTLRMIVLRAGIVSAYDETESTKGFDLMEIWRHSILTAQVSESLSRSCRRRGSDMSPQDYYTCGLLHDIGKIILYDNLGQHYVEVIARAQNEEDALEAEEQSLLGMRHSDAGHMAAILWKVPEPIPSIIRCHHRPNSLGHLTEVGKIVSCADEIANAVAKNPTADAKDVRGQVHTMPGGLSEDALMQSIAAAIASWGTIELG